MAALLGHCHWPGGGWRGRDPDAAGRPDHWRLEPLLAEPRDWSCEDIAVAGVLANAATSYVVNASKPRQQEQPSEQLQQALESRIIIEQAKGITAQQHTISVDQAYQLMRGYARNNNASLRGVAEAIVAVGLQV